MIELTEEQLIQVLNNIESINKLLYISNVLFTILIGMFLGFIFTRGVFDKWK